MNKRHLL